MIADQDLIRRESGYRQRQGNGASSERLSVPVLQAALEVERHGRESLEVKLERWKVTEG
jgi:hypothetical protein